MSSESGNKSPIPRIALVGRPNVGKSTIFNRLTGTRNALVDATPGLTRDLRYAEIRWDDFLMQLIDTGGMSQSRAQGRISRLVHGQALKAVKQADLLLIVLDAKEGLSPADREIIDTLRPYKKPRVIAVNKVDVLSRTPYLEEFYELGIDGFIPISAEHGTGISELMERVVHCLKHIDTSCDILRGGREDLIQEKKQGGGQPIKVALIGRPNTGKSSLLNRLAGEQRMIVTDIPGTTRDAIDTLLQRTDKKDILLTDTAGIRRKARVKDKIEKFSLIKAIDAIKACDIALVVMDALEGITDQDKRLIGYTEKYARACITLFNKQDLIKGDQGLVKLRTLELRQAKRFIAYSPHLNISALTGKGLKHILPLIDRVYAEFSTSINTGGANRILQKAISKRSPPISKGHHLRLYYTTQVGIRPPTFLMFANYPESIPSQYGRFIANQFREELGLKQIPVRILFRKRDKRT